jgi:hypothetical protein
MLILANSNNILQVIIMQSLLDFKFRWNTLSQKLLLCKNDSNIDIQWLKTLTRNKEIEEVSTINPYFNPEECALIHETMDALNDSNDFDQYRIFQVDHIDKNITKMDYFVGIIEFDQASFEDLILCIVLKDYLDHVNQITYEIFEDKPFDMNLIFQSTDKIFNPIKNKLDRKINRYMSNKW